MGSQLDYDLKRGMAVLTKDNRWNVLSVLILHGNIRNRCYPSMDTITEMATNGNRSKSTRAKKWLEKHGAFEVVPYDKRVDDELKLSPRQHVYQLSGVIQPCADMECDCHKIEGGALRYLYINNSNGQTIKNLNGQTFDSFTGQTGSSSIEVVKKDSAPQNGAGTSPAKQAKPPRKPNPSEPWHDALIAAFNINPETLTKTADGAYWKAANELRGSNFPVERIAELHQWCKSKDWKAFTVQAMAKHAPTFLAECKPSANGWIPVEQRTSPLDGINWFEGETPDWAKS